MNTQQRTHQRFAAATLILALALSGCSRSNDDTRTTLSPTASTIDPDQPVVLVEGEVTPSTAVDVGLSEGSSGQTDSGPSDSVDPTAQTTPLTPEQAADVLARSTTPPPVTKPQASPTTTTQAANAPTTTTPGAPTGSGTTAVPDPSSTTTPVTGAPSTPRPTTTAPNTNSDTTTTTTTTTTPTGNTPTTTSTTAPDANLPPDPGGPPQNAVLLDAIGGTDAGSPTSTDPGPLKVLRYTPEGDVSIAPYLSVTFNQPMVPLATLAALDNIEVPIAIEPATTGHWRWVGPQTARFEPDRDKENTVDRFAGATTFSVTIPASMTAVSGAQLGADVSWNFTTPPPRIVGVVGATEDVNGAPMVATEPIFVVQFGQRVSAEDVAAASTLDVGGERVSLRPAADIELKEDPAASDAVEAVAPGRAVALTPTTPLAPDQAVTLTIGPDIPSAEGPITQPKSYTYHARTHGPLRVDKVECFSTGCPAGSGFTVVFNNPLDTAELSRTDIADLVAVEPTIPGLTIDVSGATIRVDGSTAANTEYTVTVGANMADIFGQTLGSPASKTLRIGDALPSFDGPRSEMVILDPDSAAPTLAVQSVNQTKLRLMVWAVNMSDFAQYRDLRYQLDPTQDPTVPDGWQQLTDTTIDVDNRPNELVTTEINLDDQYSQAGSQLVVFVRPEPRYENFYNPLLAWVQHTDLAIDAIADESTLLIWTTDVVTGEPVAKVPVALLGDGRVATTDEEGIATVELTENIVEGLVANTGDQLTFLPPPNDEGWAISPVTKRSRWNVIDDRGIYRPGETVRLTGWLRGVDPTSDALLKTPQEGTVVAYEVTDSYGTEVASGSADTNTLGGFSLSFDTTPSTALGTMNIRLTSGESATTHSVQVEQYRTPEFEVDVEPQTAGPYVQAEPFTLRAVGSFFSGGPVANSQTHWTVATSPTSYRPPNHDRFSFGRAVETYARDTSAAYDDVSDTWCGPDCGTDRVVKTFDGTTDGTGSHYLKLDVDEPSRFPVNIAAEATITDVNRQAWAARTNVLVHPAKNYVGIRTDTMFIEKEAPLDVEAIVTDIDGKPTVGRPVTITLNLVTSQWNNGEWTETLDKVDSCSFESRDPAKTPGSTPPSANPTTATPSGSGQEAMKCSFVPQTGGEYRIVADVTDVDGDHSRSELTRWVSGSLARPATRVQLEQATIIPDKTEYQPGDTARLLVTAPWAPARGVVVISRYNVEESIPFDAEEGFAIVEVPITDRSIPNVTGWVTIAGTAPRLDVNGKPVAGATRPAVASGFINLPVSSAQRALTVVPKPATAQLRPGQTSKLSVAVTDAAGSPVSDAQVALVVVDEAVLSLSDYSLTDPNDVFYAEYQGQLQGVSAREYIQLLETDSIATGPEDSDGADASREEGAPSATTAPGDGAESSSDQASPGRDADDTSSASGSVRSNFGPLALYSPDNRTDDNGLVTVDLRVPDSLTRYRIMAIAVAEGQRFGYGESNIEAGLPLEIRPSPPRFARVGDRLNFPVVVRNTTDAERAVDVAIKTTGLDLTEAAGQRVVVPANGRVEVRFAMTATTSGTATYEVAALSGAGDAADGLRDAASGTLPVYTPTAAESVASYGTVDTLGSQAAIAQPVVVPDDVYGNYGGVQVGVSSTILNNLIDAVDYLNTETFDSTSARASHVIGVASLNDVLAAFEAPNLQSPERLVERARRSLNLLIGSQSTDGGWASWPRETESDPWSSVLAADAVFQGTAVGWGSQSDTARQATIDYLDQIENHIPDDYSQTSNWAIRGYAIKVLRSLGGSEAIKARIQANTLYSEAGDTLDPDVAAMIWPSVPGEADRAAIEQHITNRATDTAAGVTFATDYTDDDYVIAQSSQRSDAAIIDGLLEMTPESDLVAKAVRSLLDNRTDGRWNNDQANAMIVRAIRHYYDKFESDAPQMRARAWIGTTSTIDHSYSGRQLDHVVSTTPFDEARANATDGTALVTIDNTGTGRLYYRIGLRYAPTEPDQRARDDGFVVERNYEAIGDATDVTRNPDGSWKIKAGAAVRVRVTMVADAQRTNVALLDPLPAGFEPVNPSFTAAQTFTDDQFDPGEIGPIGYWPGWNWFEHQNLRDTRAEAVTSLLPGGSYEYSYVVRATTPGAYAVPGASAQELYHPETSGRSATDRVTIG